jgi:lipopolysaccharide export system permease protein
MQISFLELMELYSYVIPTILFYTFPISSFVALAISLAKLSSEYELIVITSFGLNPLRLIRIFVPILTLTTLFLLFNSLVLIPKADARYNMFKERKKVEAQFNIKPSQYGQQFASWLIYVNKEENHKFKDVVMFRQDKLNDIFIISKYATLKNRSTDLSLNLYDGKAMQIDQKVSQIDFKRMVMYNNLKVVKHIENLDDLIKYWKSSLDNHKKKYKLIFSVLLSLFPFISLLFIISLGYFNPRYNKNYTSTFAIVLTIIFIVLSQRLAKNMGFELIGLMPLVWMILSVLYYRYKIRSYY